MADAEVVARIDTGLIPLKLNTGADGRELERARFQIKSIQNFWQGRSEFKIHIVARDDEIAEIDVNLRDLISENVKIYFSSEREIFPLKSKFFLSKGMYKQQLIKLFAPEKLNLQAFLTLDADVTCRKGFSEVSFLKDGKLISAWEPRSIHSWWENSAIALRAWSDIDLPGLGVTPNTLHVDLCTQIGRYIEMRGFDPVEYLCGIAEAHPKIRIFDGESIPLAWSEYSLYTIVSEWFGNLQRYHLSPDEVAKLGFRLHSHRNIWSKDQVDRLQLDPSDPGTFLVVQSWAGVSVDRIAEVLGYNWA